MDRFIIKRRKKYSIYDAKKKTFIDTADTMDIAEKKRVYWMKKLGRSL